MSKSLKGFQPGARAVGSFVPKLTQKAFEKYGFSAASLLTDWAAVVGPDLAACSVPEKLKWPRGVDIYAGETDAGERGRPGATLLLRVDGAHALTLQYKAGQIIERINAYFGYRAVSELRILQAPVTKLAATGAASYVRLEASPAPPPLVAAIASASLRTALARMAEGMRTRHKMPH